MTDSHDERDEWPEEVVVPIEDQIDLHSFHPRDVRSVVESYLEEAVAAGFPEVRLIHGRGIGVQRKHVRSLLRDHPDVTGFFDAPDLRGGRGATIVRLSSRRMRED